MCLSQRWRESHRQYIVVEVKLGHTGVLKAIGYLVLCHLEVDTELKNMLKRKVDLCSSTLLVVNCMRFKHG